MYKPILLLLFLVNSIPSFCQISSAFVSGTGNDANGCSFSAPCRQFNRAISVVANGGTVIAVGSGNFQPFFVGKPLSVVVAEGAVATIVSTSPSTYAIKIQADGSVALHGLSLYRIPPAEPTNPCTCFGVQVLGSGELDIQDNTIVGFSAGISVLNTPRLFVRNTVITAEVGSLVGLAGKTARRIGQRYQAGGLERALFDAPRPGSAPLLNLEQSRQVIALFCSSPPEGFARWSVRLSAAETVRRKIAPSVGRETIRMLLQSHDLKPWREKNVVRRRAR